MSDNRSGAWPPDGASQHPGPGPYADPQGGPSHYGSGPPAKKKKKTGLIIGAVVTAVALIVGLGIGGWLLFGGDDDGNGNSSDQSTENSDTGEESEDPTDEASDEPSDSESESESDAPAEGSLAGTNYSYDLPGDEWRDAKDLFANATPPVTVDTAIIWGTTLDDAQANVLFEASSVPGSSLEELEEQWKTNLQAGGTPPPMDLPRTEIDGEEALAVERDFVNEAGSAVYQTVYLVLHDDYAYSIAFTRQSEGDTVEDAETAFSRVKSSFAWAD